MPRQRRRIISHQLYEICFRAKSGLPLAVTNYMSAILEGIMARVQRNHKVRLSHHVWMPNHPHFLVVARDSVECTRFYGEIQKQVTEAVKKLLGLEHLELWEDCSVIWIVDRKTAMKRISYLYLNPVKANLVRSIDCYPGLSSWRAFTSSEPAPDAEITKDCPWIRQRAIGKLPRLDLNERQDKFFTSRLLNDSHKKHKLVIEPHAWMLPFYDPSELSSIEIERVRQEIVADIVGQTAEFESSRQSQGSKVLGALRLQRQGVILRYSPQKSERSIFLMCSDSDRRIQLISEFRYFCHLCEEAYHQLRAGNTSIRWPIGAFRPPTPPTENIITYE